MGGPTVVITRPSSKPLWERSRRRGRRSSRRCWLPSPALWSANLEAAIAQESAASPVRTGACRADRQRNGGALLWTVSRTALFARAALESGLGEQRRNQQPCWPARHLQWGERSHPQWNGDRMHRTAWAISSSATTSLSPGTRRPSVVDPITSWLEVSTAITVRYRTRRRLRQSPVRHGGGCQRRQWQRSRSLLERQRRLEQSSAR